MDLVLKRTIANIFKEALLIIVASSITIIETMPSLYHYYGHIAYIFI